MVSAGRIVAIASPDSAPIKRLVQDAKEENRVIDVSCGRRTRSVIITDSEHVILSAIQAETITNRLANDLANDIADDTDEEVEAQYVSLTNCIMGVTNLVQHSSCGFVDCKVLGENWNPAFIGEGDHPYSTKARSRLCSAGRILDWMTDETTDLAGNPRVRDGKVDVGCYQCWLEPVGMSIKVK